MRQLSIKLLASIVILPPCEMCDSCGWALLNIFSQKSGSLPDIMDGAENIFTTASEVSQHAFLIDFQSIVVNAIK